jgi:hypothetical protein
MGTVIAIDTPAARERAIRELVRERCLRRGLKFTDDLTYRAMTFALDCYQRDGDSAARALTRTEDWLDVMTGKARPRGRVPTQPEPPRAA